MSSGPEQPFTDPAAASIAAEEDALFQRRQALRIHSTTATTAVAESDIEQQVRLSRERRLAFERDLAATKI